MENHPISLPIAYMIETLRSQGISNSDILSQIEKKDVTPWVHINEHFDFNQLLKLADQDQEALTSIIEDGYQVKFITIKGLQTLLKLKFQLVEGRDYQLTDKGIKDLHIKEDVWLKLKQLLSKNCMIHEEPLQNEKSYKKVKIELAL
ncbi:hypothetical protein [Lederbergia galactosidilytica]|uniref:Uncharacterized protein n=1 Tax=Lederbergia galactosidilytica TaxID=217031 RepID=A0A0Q9Y4B4_9BACI|nr:hypothetical protein [Lederbergia galactosidilytica]KRG11796.1 hypothetical protein ACA29_14690 [Lederbergia galactosidilytica]KRG12714.1 hypothetical protein ACA30_18235 [Virgibacillus soli]MBP1916528.1 hypothetical protein [Lederbergia galactosidilytica]OAK71950.1 hypothetical protein ABB05_09935 [Lederbergia galactosidilytica]